MKLILAVFLLIHFSATAQTYYIVRHAEKAVVPEGADRMMASDPPLSEAGEARAQDLQAWLKDKDVTYIFTTPYKRTISTVAPFSKTSGIGIVKYPARPDSMDAFIAQLKQINSGSIVVAGHSNTIDDIANKLCGKNVVPGDLPETEYDNIFIVKKEGDTYTFTREKYGVPTP